MTWDKFWSHCTESNDSSVVVVSFQDILKRARCSEAVYIEQLLKKKDRNQCEKEQCQEEDWIGSH